MGAMLALEEAQSRIVALAPDPRASCIKTKDAAGRYLVSDLLALRTQPSADLSAMDGYAISGEGPWVLVGESRAGQPFDGVLGAGECVRISTGAHMPTGSDRVLIQENAEVEGDRVVCTQDMPDAGKHVRKSGFDFAEGDRLLGAGTRLDPAKIALALGGGHFEVDVARAPTVAIIDSGDELSADPANCGPHQIPASNGAMLSAMLEQIGCVVKRIGPVPDDRDALAQALADAEECDIVVTSGGASVGDHDLIQPALKDWGASLDFWKVAIKPGKPLMVATRDDQVIFGLPGNPVSAFVTAHLFVLPFVRASMGASICEPAWVTLQCGVELPAVGSRREFLRALWDGHAVYPTDSQDSSALAALAASNCLIDRAANSPALDKGATVPCYLIDSFPTA